MLVTLTIFMDLTFVQDDGGGGREDVEGNSGISGLRSLASSATSLVDGLELAVSGLQLLQSAAGSLQSFLGATRGFGQSGMLFG